MGMRATIFTAIQNKLLTVANFKGADGTTRVYPYERTNQDGFPAASITDGGKTESVIIDTLRDKRTYYYNVRLYQEILAEDRGRAEGDRIMRELEDTVLAVFDADNDLSVAGVLRTVPINTSWGYLEGGKLRVIDITLAVETAAIVNP